MNISESLIRDIVLQVLEQTKNSSKPAFEKHVDPSGIIGVKTSTVKLEPFSGRNDVLLKDITTLEEAPRMGCGIMELKDGASYVA